ncbi:MAG: metallophosphoesterase [Deltaproteobacteria bacterium]|nr:MAG: metallophosphoesterase [Deltaproteobacteria bacterium]
MLRIGVISDTHLPASGEALAFLADLAASRFQGVDMILHAGDIVAPDVLAAFAPVPVYGVRGNMDPAAPGLPHKRIVRVAGVRIGLIHGWGARQGLIQRIRGEFRDEALDCLVFGHSHEPLCQREGNLLLFNPGSATDPRGLPHASVGLLEIANGSIDGRIIPLA